MQKGWDKEHFIAIAICGECKQETPLTHRACLVKEGYEDINIWSTPCCDIVPYDENDIKGYVSIDELKEMGYEEVKDES